MDTVGAFVCNFEFLLFNNKGETKPNQTGHKSVVVARSPQLLHVEVELLVGHRWQRPDILVKVDHQLARSIIMMRMVLAVMVVLLVI